MNKELLKDTLGWGFVLWFIGFILGVILFKVVSPSSIGWIITPIGTFITLWVLMKKIRSEYFSHYVKIAVVWTLIAVVLDNLLIVRAFDAGDAYYRTTIYLYYGLTFFLPVIVGSYKNTPDS